LTGVLGVGGAPDAGGREARILVVGRAEDAIGLWTHRVDSVVRLPRRAIEAPPAGLVAERRALLRGLGRLEGRLIILLDLAALCGRLGLPSAPSAERGAA
jgi:purine-binding chemotaxis protein CheW